ncbi:MAG: FIST C-terminal domain-containing protein [Planctomycetes bacterium]|nr:FIST C-terminal domain-containing protein [Planctomycetota bacterium]
MRVSTISYLQNGEWSDRLPDLDSPETLVVVFGASSYYDDTKPFERLKSAFPNSSIIGCSTAGEIFGLNLYDQSLAVAVAKFDRSRLRTVSASVTNAGESFSAGERLAKVLHAPDLRGVFVLSDGLSVNGSELIRGLNSNLPPGVVITGGLAGDGDQFKRTWVLEDGMPATQRVSAVGIYGENVHIGHGSKGGWDIFGPQRTITKSKDNVLYELDGRPALALYKEYLGERASGLPATALLFPLAVRSSPAEAKVLVRTVLSVDEASQSMTFAGDVPMGACAQLMRANFERIIDGASLAAKDTKACMDDDCAASLSIAISCVGRRLILGERTEEEIEAALDALPSGTQQIGFYSYGEISPYADGQSDLHNQTMTLTTLMEH